MTSSIRDNGLTEAQKRRLRAYSLHDAPGHLIRRCQQRAVDLFIEEVGEDGPTPPQFGVLLCVFQNPGLSQTELVRASGIDRSTLTEILRRMISRGLVSRTRTAEDRRANALRLTPAGEVALASAFDAMQRSQDRILEPLPAESRRRALDILIALAACDSDPGN